MTAAPIGVFPGTPYEEYARWDALRSSYLRHFKRTPLHARQQYVAPSAPSAAFDQGNLIHTAILEPELLEARYVRSIKVDRRYIAGKALWAQFEADNAGKEIVDPVDFDAALAVRDSVWKHSWAPALLGGKGSNELAMGWEDARFKVACKARIDRYVADFDGSPAIVDLKSTADAGVESFRRSIETFDYGLQAAFYLDGMETLSPHYRQWIWVAIEKHPPFACALYTPDDEVLEAGRGRYRTAIAAHLEGVRTGIWPGYPQRPLLIGRPAWARKASEQLAEAGL